MVTDQIKQLAATRAKLASLEKNVALQLNKELAALPGKYGFDSVESFAKAVKAATRGKKPTPVAKGPQKKRHPRSVITDATRAEVKKLVEAGKTGGQIAKTVGISLPSVQNIKKALGLVKKG